jgi:trans-aconitate 2-methyltransferase
MWNPQQYLKFQGPRIQPAIDLLSKSSLMSGDPTLVRSVLDLGCGSGNITRLLLQSFVNAEIEGLDSSIEMIESAKALNFHHDNFRVSFQHEKIENKPEICVLTSKTYDIIYSNAALHWCGYHEVFLPRVIQTMLNPQGGVLGVQMPDTKNQLSHTLMVEAARQCGYLELMKDVRIPQSQDTAEWYFNLLVPFSKKVIH